MLLAPAMASENRKLWGWRRILIVTSAAFYLSVWVFFTAQELVRTNEKFWRVEQHHKPHKNTLIPYSKAWYVILATEDFLVLSSAYRAQEAERKFNQNVGLAGELGYDLRAMREWLHDTARHAEEFPLKSYFTRDGDEIAYRDLRASGFPRRDDSTFAHIFFKELFTRYDLVVSFFLMPFICAPIFIAVGMVEAFRSPDLGLRWRAVVLALSLVFLLQAILYHYLYVLGESGVGSQPALAPLKGVSKAA